jgi:hypothetical protein
MAERYVKADEVSRRNVLKKLQSLTTIRHSAATQESIDRLHSEVADRVNQEGLRDVSTKDFAEAAGLLDYYNTAYAYFSQSAHANVRDLEALLDKDLHGDLVAVRYGPEGDFQTNVLATSIESVIIALEAAFDLIEKAAPIGTRVIRRKMEGLFETMQ